MNIIAEGVQEKTARQEAAIYPEHSLTNIQGARQKISVTCLNLSVEKKKKKISPTQKDLYHCVPMNLEVMGSDVNKSYF